MYPYVQVVELAGWLTANARLVMDLCDALRQSGTPALHTGHASTWQPGQAIKGGPLTSRSPRKPSGFSTDQVRGYSQSGSLQAARARMRHCNRSTSMGFPFH